MENLYPDLNFILMSGIFIAAAIIVNVLIFNPVLKLLALRKSLTSSRIELAIATDLKTNDMIQDYQNRLHAAKLQGNQAKEKIKNEAMTKASELIKGTRQNIEADFAAKKQELDLAINEAKGTLGNVAINMSKSIAEKMLGKSIN